MYDTAGERETVHFERADTGNRPVRRVPFTVGLLDNPHLDFLSLIHILREAENAVSYLRGIEATTGLTCTGIVNNTHLCGETTEREIRKGADLAAAVSRETGIPVLCHVAEERFVPNLSDLSETVFPITIKMKKPWE